MQKELGLTIYSTGCNGGGKQYVNAQKQFFFWTLFLSVPIVKSHPRNYWPNFDKKMAEWCVLLCQITMICLRGPRANKWNHISSLVWCTIIHFCRDAIYHKKSPHSVTASWLFQILEAKCMLALFLGDSILFCRPRISVLYVRGTWQT